MKATDNGLFTPEPGSGLPPSSNRGQVVDSIHTDHYSPAWFSPVMTPENLGWMASVDMVRLEVKFDYHTSNHDQAFTDWVDFFARYGAADFADRFTSSRPAQYREVVNLIFDAHHFDQETGRLVLDRSEDTACSLSVGIGWNKPSAALEPRTGFIEFNPNKCAIHAFRLLMRLQNSFQVRFRLVRWDFALDIPCKRSELVVLKDARSYESHISKSCTVYLGQRNTPGRVKVYDKTAESRLLGTWSRIEVTYGCPDFGSDGEILPPPSRFWPKVGRVAAVTEGPAPDSASGPRIVLAQALAALLQLGQDIEPYLQAISDRKTRTRVRQMLVPDPLPFSVEAWKVCARRALDWQDPARVLVALRLADFDA